MHSSSVHYFFEAKEVVASRLANRSNAFNHLSPAPVPVEYLFTCCYLFPSKLFDSLDYFSSCNIVLCLFRILA